MLSSPPLWKPAITLLGTWIIWRILRRLVRKDPLAILPGPPSDSWATGNLMKVIDNDGWENHQDLMANYGKAFRITGPFKENIIFIYDTKALHHVVVKDGSMYEPTEDFSQLTRLIMGNAILGTIGDHHRNQRKMLTPVFSIAHMREMTPIFHDVVRKLGKTIVQQVSQGEKEIDMLSWMTRTALELIGQSGYGYSFDTLEPDTPLHPFYTSIKNLNRAAHNNAMVLARYFVLPYVYGLGSPRFQRAVVDLIPWKKLHELRDMADVMHNTSLEIFAATKQAMEEGDLGGRTTRIGAGKDIMSVLLKYNASASEKERLPDNELLAQISALTFAAMDTTSNSLSRILHILSENPEAQERLRDEIRAAQADHGSEELDYDALNALPYLDAVCRETLRLYAPIPFLMREAQADTILPLSNPIVSIDGKPLHEILVPKKTRIMVSLLHCNRDPDIWGDDAAEWKPERWMNPLPESVARARVPGVYSNLMTFMGGGRSCLGFKFSQLEMKVVLCHLLPAIQVAPSGRKVKWQLNLLYQPTTEDAELTSVGDRKLQLPLNISLAQPGCSRRTSVDETSAG